MSTPVIVIDRMGRIVGWNRSCEELTAYQTADVIGKRACDFLIAPEDRERAQATFDGVCSGTLLNRFEGRLVTKLGAKYWYVWSCTVTRSVDGTLEHVVATGFDATERQRAEEEMRHSHERFRLLVEGVREYAIFTLDAQGRVTSWNEGAERIIGYRDDEILGRRASVFLTPEARAQGCPERALEAAAREGRVVDEGWRVRKDGSRFWADVTLTAQRDTAGRLSGFLKIARDITDKRRAEKALRFSEAKFAGIVAISADAIISINEEQHITMFNEGAERMFGYTKDEVLGTSLDILVPERLREVHRRRVRGFIAGPVVARRMGERGLALVGRRRNGVEFPIDAAISKLSITGTHIITVAVRDISELKRFENELQLLSRAGEILTSSLLLADTLQGIAELVVGSYADCCLIDIVGEDGQLRHEAAATSVASKRDIVERMSRLTVDRTRPHLARGVIETRAPELISQVTIGFFEDVAQSEEQLLVLQQFAPTSFIAAPVVARDRLYGALVWLACREERHFGTEDLAVAEQLAHRVALAIENARLYQTARQALLARDETLAFVAHDLRNPLNSILLQAEAVRRRGAARPKRDPLQSIVRSVEMMDGLIQDLLEITRSGKIVLERKREVVPALVQEAVTRIGPLSNGVAIHAEVQEDAPPVAADRERILRVFANLLSNALKFCTADCRVLVGAHRVGEEVCFSVADTGPGIRPEHLEHIFDRYWQAQAGDRRGVGLGLSICKSIVQAHGGRIWVESEPGKGTKMLFTVPVAGDEEASAAHASV